MRACDLELITAAMELGAWVSRHSDAARRLFEAMNSNISVAQLEWAARNANKLDDKFWSIVAEVPLETVPVIVEAWKVDEAMPGLPPRKPDTAAADAEATRAERKRGKARATVVHSDTSDNSDSESYSRRPKRSRGELDGFVVPDDAPIDYESEDDAVAPGTNGVIPGPHDVDKYYRTDMGRDGMCYFRLVEFRPNNRHLIQWLYRPDELPRRHADNKLVVELGSRTKSIGALALLDSNHTQELDPRDGAWVEITDELVHTPVPHCAAPPIRYYVISTFDVEADTIGSDRSYADQVVEQLLTIGPAQGRVFKKRIDEPWGMSECKRHQGRCGACGLMRSLTREVKIYGEPVFRLGIDCYNKIEIAKRINDASSERQRRRLIQEAAEVNAAAAARYGSERV